MDNLQPTLSSIRHHINITSTKFGYFSIFKLKSFLNLKKIDENVLINIVRASKRFQSYQFILILYCFIRAWSGACVTRHQVFRDIKLLRVIVLENKKKTWI